MGIKEFMFKSVKDADVTHDIVEVTGIEDEPLYEEFINEYDTFKDLSFNDIQYRKGAVVTCPFGLSEGFKYINGKMEWGYVRNHTGVDRAGGGNQTFDWGTVKDIVKVPFNFNRSMFFEYGDKSYGTLTSLFNDKYGFVMRIAHMNPDQKNRKGREKGAMIPWSLKLLKRKKPMNQNYILGSAGTLGDSSGPHTHTEFKSIDESCEVFDILLNKKYGQSSLKEYSSNEVIMEYSKYKHYKSASDDAILKDYSKMKKEKRIIFLNRFKCQYVDWDKTIKTRYSSEMLFNGL